jgi:UDP-N-acetylmuramyl pentapeptide phosphotransferase/UDP-N-acetylglucosamine-1-phosphate transferase
MLLSVCLCFLSDRVARRLGWLDMPSPRRIHQTPKTRIAGVGMALAFLPPAYMVGQATLPPNFLPEYHAGLVGLAFITAFMAIDDVVDLAPWPKLAAQAIAALLPMMAGLRIDYVSTPLNNPLNPNPIASPLLLPPALAVVVTIVWFVGMMNAVNALDGIDGLAAGVVAIASGALALHTARFMGAEIGVAYVLALVVAVCTGYLVWNWPPSRFLMGDSGAHFLGYVLAFLSILGGARLATALLVFGIPILDYAYVLYTRIRTGRAAMRFDLGHLHHRLLSVGLAPAAILGLLYALTVLAGAAALFLEKTQKLFAFVVLAALGWVIIVELPRRLEKRPLGPAAPPSDASPLGQGGEAAEQS